MAMSLRALFLSFSLSYSLFSRTPNSVSFLRRIASASFDINSIGNSQSKMKSRQNVSSPTNPMGCLTSFLEHFRIGLCGVAQMKHNRPIVNLAGAHSLNVIVRQFILELKSAFTASDWPFLFSIFFLLPLTPIAFSFTVAIIISLGVKARTIGTTFPLLTMHKTKHKLCFKPFSVGSSLCLPVIYLRCTFLTFCEQMTLTRRSSFSHRASHRPLNGPSYSPARSGTNMRGREMGYAFFLPLKFSLAQSFSSRRFLRVGVNSSRYSLHYDTE